MSAPSLPPVGPDMRQWGQNITGYLRRTMDRIRYYTQTDIPAQNGTILWDEENGYPIIAKSGVWQPVTMEDALDVAKQAAIDTAAIEAAALDAIQTAALESAIATAVEEALSFDIVQAERVIFETYSDTVSVKDKAKNLTKFGVNLLVGTSFETVGQFQGTTANETYATTNSVDSIVSDDTANNGTVIVLEGHTIDGSGNLTFSTQEVTLATPATTPVTLGTALARANRMYPKASGTFNSPQTDIAGNVYVYDSTEATGVTAGVPDVASATKLMLVDENQTQKCATSISSGDYWFITAIDAGIGAAGGPADRVRVRIETRDVFNGGVWRPLGRDLTLDIDQNGVQQSEKPFLIVPKNHDVRVRALTNASTASVFAEVRGYLAEIVP